MAKYLFTFPSDAMDHIAEEEMPEVARAAHAVCQEAIDAGVYVLAGGLEDQPACIVAADGTVTKVRTRTWSAESPSWTCRRGRRR